jgi:hypothetical protein
MDILSPLKWMGIFFIGIVVVYLVGRILSAAIFRSWFEAKISYFRRKKNASTTDKTSD